MSRHMVHLEGAFHDLQCRYGADDPIVQQLRQEIETFQAIESISRRWRVTHRERNAITAIERRSDGVAGGTNQ